MIIVLKNNVSEDVLEQIKSRLSASGFTFNVLTGVKYTILPVVGDLSGEDVARFKALPGVEKILRVSLPYYLVTREYREEPTLIDLGDGVVLGEGNFHFIAGPCSVEGEERLREVAAFLNEKGVKILRGGAFKLRSSPYSFQGLGKKGLKILADVAKEMGFKTVSEITDIRELDAFAEIDVIQVGARNMFNYPLLKELAATEKPILLKRAPSAKIEDFLLSAEYLLSGGNFNVILCERGVVGIDNVTRNNINMADPVILRELSHLPVCIDPSHGVGIARYIPRVALASIVLGVDAVMLEVHQNPPEALSDGYQSLDFKAFGELLEKAERLRHLFD